jgi:hypothetical protein
LLSPSTGLQFNASQYCVQPRGRLHQRRRVARVAALPDDLVGAREQRRLHSQAERHGCSTH